MLSLKVVNGIKPRKSQRNSSHGITHFTLENVHVYAWFRPMTGLLNSHTMSAVDEPAIYYFRFEKYVDDKYKDFHRTKGDAEALASVDVMGALDMYADQGEWEKCITTAEQQVHVVS